MKVFIVMYINSAYEDVIQGIYLSRESAYNSIPKDVDNVNYYVTEWDINE